MENRIVVYAPVGRDAPLASKVFEAGGFHCCICHGVADILHELARGAGALFIVEEAIGSGALAPLASYVSGQPDWSDLPILVLTTHGVDSPGLLRVIEQLGNVTLLERPVRSATLLSAARSALRGRMRQYHMRETDKIKDEFLASLGHELRNPLAPIRTAMQVLDHRLSDQPQVQAVTQIVERQVAHLTRLVDDLLDVARISSGKVTLQRTRILLAQVVAHAVEICGPLLAASGHTIEVVQPEQEVWIDGDRARLVQSLSNVLANAIKFTPQPSAIHLQVSAEGKDLTFRIRDSGVGLDRASLSKIFEMFAQSDPARGQSLGGLGIGLSLTKRFTEMHGGSIWATSAGPGQGSEFTLRLPIVVEPAPAPPIATEATAAAAATAEKPDSDAADGSIAGNDGSCRVLVVDDNTDGADMLEMMLTLDGYTVFKAHRGEQAVDMVEQSRPHAVLMDIGLPDMDGYEAARRIREQPGGKDVVVIALTGWGHADARRRTQEAGMDHHLVKPVNLNVLKAHLARIDPSQAAA